MYRSSILFDRTSILFVEQAVYRPSTPYLDAFCTFACEMQDVVWSNQALSGLDDSYAWDLRPVKNTVCLSLLEFCPPGVNPEFVMECKLIAHPI